MRIKSARVGLVFLFVLLLARPVFAEWFVEKQGIMGTEISLTLWHSDPLKAQEVADAVMAEMRRIDSELSPYKEQSPLAQVNLHAAEKPQTISAEFVALIDKSLWYSRLSGGAFDITFASVGHYYNYREHEKPSDALRESLLPAINYQWLKLDKQHSTIFFDHKNVKIDLGGIAKGYAVDRAAEILLARGVDHASISAGGDSRVLGDRFGRPWVVGIKNPRAPEGSADAVIKLPLADVALSTSGDYERYFIDEGSGERIHHIINPRTGKSASEVMSVTIIGERGLDTDPLSTTVFVLGTEAGLALLEKLPGIDGIIIDAAGKVHYSSGLTAPNE